MTPYGANHPEVAATISISSGWGEVAPGRPRNYLIVVGAWEFASSSYVDIRLAWLTVAYVAALLFARPLAGWLRGGPGPAPYKAPSLGATVAVFAAAAAGAPLLARLLPDGWVPQAVAGYMTNYYALFGLLALGGALLFGAGRAWPLREWLNGRALLTGLGLEIYLFAAFAVLGHFTAGPLVPIAARLPWVLAMLPGALLYFAAGELLIRGQATWRAALVADLAHKGLVLVSLVAAILFLGAPFFLVLLLPVMVLLFAGLVALNRWLYGAGGNPLIGALVSALATSGLMAAIFPLLR